MSLTEKFNSSYGKKKNKVIINVEKSNIFFFCVCVF